MGQALHMEHMGKRRWVEMAGLIVAIVVMVGVAGLLVARLMAMP